MSSIRRKKSSLTQAMMQAIFITILAFTTTLPLAAATYTVTNTNDSGPGSLRQAILDANANPGPDVIDATGVSGTITINPANYFLVITDDLTINGPGQANLTISGGGASRIFWIQNGAITIQDLTLADGYAKGGNGGGGGMGAGGAIFMHEGKQGTNPTDVATGSINLTLINVTLKDNVAQGGNGGSGNVTGGGGMGGNGNSGGASGGVLGSAVGYEYGGSVTDATTSARGTNGGIAIFGSGGREGSPLDAGFGGGGGGDEAGGFAGGGGGATIGGGSFGRGGFGGGGGNAGTDNNFTNNGGARGGFGGGGGGLAFPGNGSNGDAGNDNGQAGFGGGNGTTIAGGGMGAGGAIFVASGTLTMKSVTFQNNTATGGTGGNNGQGRGGALFIFNKTDNGGNDAPGTTNDPQVSGCNLTFSGNSASTSSNNTYGSIGSASGCPLILTAEGPAGPLMNGAPVIVTIKADKFTNIGTLQFSVNWDPSELQLDGNTPLTIDDDAPLIGTPAAGQLTYTWFDADFPDYGVTLPDGTTILTLNFTVVAGGPTTGVSVEITDTPTTVEASDNNFETVPVTLMNLVDFDVIVSADKPLVFLAAEDVVINRQGPSEGSIHANNDITFKKGSPSTYTGDLTAVDDIAIATKNTINGSATAGDEVTVASGASVGLTSPNSSVAAEALPNPSFTAGGNNVTVAANGSLTLPAGAYGVAIVNKNATLNLSAGDYFFTKLELKELAKLVINVSGGEVKVNVVEKLFFGLKTAVSITPSGEDGSDQVTFTQLDDAQVTIGESAKVLGNIIAVEATVKLSKKSRFKGSICANKIVVDPGAVFLPNGSSTPLPSITNSDDGEELEEVQSEEVTSVATDYELSANYPNPFNPSTIISFALPEAGKVTLRIYSVTGQLVRELTNGSFASGKHQLVWDAQDEKGMRVASGLYFYKLMVQPENGGAPFVQTKKMTLLK